LIVLIAYVHRSNASMLVLLCSRCRDFVATLHTARRTAGDPRVRPEDGLIPVVSTDQSSKYRVITRRASWHGRPQATASGQENVFEIKTK
jgi:hypothetical protein